MELWIIISIAAAAFQTLRFMLQKHLSMGVLSTGGATFARFIYSMPVIVTLAGCYLIYTGTALPDFSGRFWFYALTGGLAQILATWCVVALFRQRNFAVGITFKKSEVIQTALVGFIVLGDRVSLIGLGAIVLGLIGVLILSDNPAGRGNRVQRLVNPAAGLGLASGALFAISAVAYRGATLEIVSADPLLRAAVTLAVVTSAQAIGMAIWLLWRETGEVGRVLAAWRTAMWMGVTSMAGSLCWFTAFTLQSAAYVFAVGQIEVIFSMLASVLFFRERIARREVLGIGVLSASILGLILMA